VTSKRWLAAAATTWWAAEEALKAMKPRFAVTAPVSTDAVAARLGTMVRSGPGFRLTETGFGADAMSRVDMARIYEIDAAYAAPLETATATARLTDGKLELWIASQAPEQARIAAARAIGVAPEDVALYPMAAGGSFDARLEHDHAIEIALIAKALAKQGITAVQLTWPRRSEVVRARPRAPAHIMIGAQVAKGGSGALDAMRVRLACPPAMLEFGGRLFGNLTSQAAIAKAKGRKDPLACEGAVPPYAIPSVTVEHIPTEIGLPVGRVRGNAAGYNAFAMESFIDEIAAKFGREPLSFRMAMLGNDVRLAACLQRAAQLAGWDGGADQSGEGLACVRLGDLESGARIACVASARPGEGGVRVTRLSAAVDIGRIINLDIARQQIEGGLVFGIGMALGRAIRLRGGVPERSDYGAFGVPGLADCPEMAIEFIESEAPPVDPGELGAIVAPPAIANALFSATGLRLRRLPLLSEGI
jgi:isoquinoline 1-oxidoreductase subunit beta